MAQWQSIGLWIQGLGVQVPSLTLFLMKNYLKKIKKALSKTRDNLSIFDAGEMNWEELEEALILSDVGPQTTEKIIEKAKNNLSENASSYGIKLELKKEIMEILKGLPSIEHEPPEIMLLVGVNGSGKTTTGGKLANILKERGKVLLVAADTFRAAAREQLKKLAEVVGVDYFGGDEFKDPAAVGFEAARKSYDFIIIDTAGRLHTKENLMREALKIKKSVEKSSGRKPRVYLILDGTIGQNSLFQAEEFSKALETDGIIITKLDGTAKGGAIIPIAMKIKTPILYLGVGEGMDDLIPFDVSSFVEALFGA